MNKLSKTESAWFLNVLCVGLQCVIVVFPDHTHLFFLLVVYFQMNKFAVFIRTNTTDFKRKTKKNLTCYLELIDISVPWNTVCNKECTGYSDDLWINIEFVQSSLEPLYEGHPMMNQTYSIAQ